jgi:uncharacterized membrane protein (UPF0127 family)
MRLPLTRVLRLAAMAILAGCAVSVAALLPVRAAGHDVIKIVGRLGVHAFTVELATNDAERDRGLMFRKQLAPNHGMLFDFKSEQPLAFWMHDTYISLDMMFIGGDGRIRRIEEAAQPMSDTIIRSGAPARAVLEVIAGTARKFGIAPGDRVTGSVFGQAR